MLRRFHITDADHRKKEEFKKSRGLLPISWSATCEASSWANRKSGWLLPMLVSWPMSWVGANCTSPCFLAANFVATSLTALGDPMDCHAKKVLVRKKSISCLFLGFPLPPAFPFMVAAANKIGSTPCSFLK